jgi:pimeloyl-ACP methyl ester carboxylesterase
MIRPLLILAALPLMLGAQENTTVTPANPAPASPTPAAEQVMERLEPGRFRKVFEQFRTERAALSPDGRHIAYTLRENEAVTVVVIDLDHPETLKTRVKVVDDAGATLTLGANQRERSPGRVLWMRWVTDTRLLVATNERFPRGTGAVLGFDADGSDARKLADPRNLLPEVPPPGGAFVTGRPRRTESLLPTPDQDDTETEETEELDQFGFPIPAETDAILDSSDTPEVVQTENLRVYDLDSKRPGAVTLFSTGTSRGNGTYRMAFLSLDAATGKLTEIESNLVQEREAILPDRQGRPRLTLPNTTLDRFPFRYTYQGATGGSRAEPLEKVLGVPGFTVSPGNYFGERSIPIGFSDDPNILYYASNVGRNTFGLYSFNLADGQRGSLAMENPGYDLIGPPGADFADRSTLVFDRFTNQLAGVRMQTNRRTTAWLRPEWQSVQDELEKNLPGRPVELLEWDSTANRFLVAIEGPADPGAFHVYDRNQGRLLEIVRRAPWVDARHTYPTLSFGFALGDGTRLEGFVTVPTQPRLKLIPMIVLCPDMPWLRVTPAYDREVHALAGMGFVVVQLNSRGAWGTGRQQREAITAGYDLVQIGDLVAAVEALGQRFKVDPKRVAVMGRGHGGFIALRALQEYPDTFRCAIALEAPVDLGDWLANIDATEHENVLPPLTRAWFGDEARFRAKPLVSAPEKVTKPILLLSYPGLEGESTRLFYLAGRRFAASVRGHGGTVEFADLRTDYVQGLPGARAEVFEQIEGFLNEHIYDFNVKFGPLEVLPEKTP